MNGRLRHWLHREGRLVIREHPEGGSCLRVVPARLLRLRRAVLACLDAISRLHRLVDAHFTRRAWIDGAPVRRLIAEDVSTGKRSATEEAQL